MKSIYLSIAFLVFSFSSTFAGIYGGQIEWEQLSQDTFKVDAIFYTPCDTSLTLANTELNILSNCTSRVVNFNSYRRQDVTPVCKTQCSLCSNSSCAFKYGFIKHSFSTIVITSYERSKSCCEISLVLAEGQRQFTLTTGGANSKFYISSMLNICQKDLLPKISWDHDPQFLTCLGRDVQYKYGIDKVNTTDSLVNSIHCPQTSATSTTFFSSSYDCNKPLYYLGFPKTGLKFPRGYHVDSVTGSVKFRPMKVEAATTGIKTEVYRNGKIIAVAAREFPIIVIKCPDNNPPVLSGINLSAPDEDNFKAKFCANTNHCITIGTADKEENDTLVPFLLNSNLPNATISLDTTNYKRPQYNICFRADSTMQGKSFSFEILLTDNACPVPASITKKYTITIDTPDMPIMVGSTSKINCDTFMFTYQGLNKVNTQAVNWYIDNKWVTTSPNFNHRFQDTGQYIIKATLNTCGIRDSFIDTVYVNGLNKLKLTGFEDTTVCAETTLLLKPSVSGNVGNILYKISMNYFDKKGNKNYINQTDPIINEKLVYNDNVRFGVGYHITDSISGCTLNKWISVTQFPSTYKGLGKDLFICAGQDSVVVFNNYQKQKGWTGDGLINDTLDTKPLKRPAEYKFNYEFRGESECILSERSIILYDHINLFPVDTITSCVGADEIRVNPALGMGTYSGNKIDSNVFTPNKANAGLSKLFYTVNFNGCNFFDSILIDIKDYVPTTGLANDYSACLSDSITFINPSTQGGKWSGPGYSSLKNELEINTIDFKAGKHEFVYEITDSNQCSAKDIVEINILNGPTIKDYRIGRNNTICNGDSFELYADVDSAIWKIQNKTFYGSQTKSVYFGNADTYFDVALTAIDSQGCSTNANINVYNSPIPDAFFKVNSLVKKGDTISPTNIRTTDQNHTYIWHLAKPIDKTWNTFQPEFSIDTIGLFSLTLTVIDTNTLCFDVFRRDIKVYGTNSISEINDEISIFPSPVTDIIEISSEIENLSQIRIYSITGKEVLRTKVEAQNVSLNVKHLAKGTYIVEIDTLNKTLVKKIIKN